MKTITTSKGIIFAIDDDDYERFKHFVWHSQYNKTAKNFYAYRTTPRGGVRGVKTGKGIGIKTKLYLHREIMACPKGRQVDHINHDALDCRKQNLRISSVSQNQSNRLGAQSNSISGVRGVYFDKVRKKFMARLRLNNKEIHLGRFSSLEEADAAAIAGRNKYFGEFAGK